jgi:DNA polymerase-1
VLLPWLEQQVLKAFWPASPASWAKRRPLSRRRRRGKTCPAQRRRPSCAAAARQIEPAFTAADYELITDEKALDDWVAEATSAGHGRLRLRERCA